MQSSCYGCHTNQTFRCDYGNPLRTCLKQTHVTYFKISVILSYLSNNTPLWMNGWYVGMVAPLGADCGWLLQSTVKMCPQITGKHHINIKPSISEELVTPCNHLLMVSIQAKQHSIGDEWMVCGNDGTVRLFIFIWILYDWLTAWSFPQCNFLSCLDQIL